LSGQDENTYYIAGGERVALDSDPNHVAVDLARATEASLPKARQAELRREGQTLRRQVVLLAGSALDETDRTKLDRVGALLPVYRSHDTTIVVLPEVRVECRDSKQVPKLRRRLEAAGVDPKSVRVRGGRVSFVPGSGRSDEALSLANVLYEEFEPEAAQARFLRVVPRPDR
jgi:hypothetical protein